jgi:hypothetical protein
MSLKKEIVRELSSSPVEFVSLSHLVCALGYDRKRILGVMTELAKAGAVTVVAKYQRKTQRGGIATEFVYRSKAGIERLLQTKTRPRSARARMWRAIRALAKVGPFTRQDLASLAETSMVSARQYTKELRRLGLLREVTRGRWMLEKDPGPETPRVPSRKKRGKQKTNCEDPYPS